MSVPEYLNLLISRRVLHVGSKVNRSSSRRRQELSGHRALCWIDPFFRKRELNDVPGATGWNFDIPECLPLRNRKKNREERLTIVPLTDCTALPRSTSITGDCIPYTRLRGYTTCIYFICKRWRCIESSNYVYSRRRFPFIFASSPKIWYRARESLAYTRIYWNRRLRVTSRY